LSCRPAVWRSPVSAQGPGSSHQRAAPRTSSSAMRATTRSAPRDTASRSATRSPWSRHPTC
jgi:hypothetical protein